MNGLYIGRFDPFHVGHLRAYNSLSSISNSIKVGVGATRETDLFSLEERKEMVRLNTGIIPVELEDLSKSHPLYFDWGKYVLQILGDVDIIATGNEFVGKDFMQHNIPVLWLPRYGGISGTQIRSLIRTKDELWKLLVPEETLGYINKLDLKTKVKSQTCLATLKSEELKN